MADWLSRGSPEISLLTPHETPSTLKEKGQVFASPAPTPTAEDASSGAVPIVAQTFASRIPSAASPPHRKVWGWLSTVSSSSRYTTPL